MSARWVARALAPLALALPCACRAFGPPPAGLDELPPAAEVAWEGAQRRVGRVRLSSTRFAGEFTAALVTVAGERPLFRLQLLPEVGGKVLDLACDGERVVGYFPHVDVELDHVLGAGRPPRNVLAFLAAGLLENTTPVRGRVRGARPAGGVHELLLEPLLAGSEVVLVLDARGAPLARRYRVRGVRFVEELAPVHRFVGKDFLWVLEDVEAEAIDAPPSELFRLELPAGGA